MGKLLKAVKALGLAADCICDYGFVGGFHGREDGVMIESLNPTRIDWINSKTELAKLRNELFARHGRI